MCNDTTLKYRTHEKILGVSTDNKLSFDEHINICETAVMYCKSQNIFMSRL